MKKKFNKILKLKSDFNSELTTFVFVIFIFLKAFDLLAFNILFFNLSFFISLLRNLICFAILFDVAFFIFSKFYGWNYRILSWYE